MARLRTIVAWVMALKPVRVLRHFAERRGFLLAAGLSYQSIFAVFAALWVGFATFGIVLSGHPSLSRAFFGFLSRSVPGLFSTETADGAIDPQALLELPVLGWTGAIAAVGLLFTAIGWLASARDAVRALFDLPGQKRNVVLLRLKDLGLALAFAAAVLVSAGLLVFSTQALGTALGWLGVPERSFAAAAAGRAIGLLLMLVLDTAVLAVLYRVLSGLQIPARRLLRGALVGAVALGALKVLGGALLRGAGANPLLASFAVIVGLLVWFNLVCEVILLTASWIAVGMADDGLAADRSLARTKNGVGRPR
jgi:membrane protein